VLGFEDQGARLLLAEDRLNQEDPYFFKAKPSFF
jgi:hypothetical protein